MHQDLFRSVMETMEEGVAFLEEGIVTYANPSLGKILRRPGEALSGRSIETLLPPSEHERIRTLLGRRQTHGKASFHEVNFLDPEGRDILVTVSGGKPSPGEGTAAFLLVQDVTERKRVQEATKRALDTYERLYQESCRKEKIYASMLGSSPDCVVLYDLVGTVTYVNRTFTETFGWSLEELQEKALPFVPEAEKDASVSQMMRVVETGLPSPPFETRRYTKDGRLLPVTMVISRYLDPGGALTGLLTAFRDISETKSLEAQLKQAHKMEAIGILAGGIAHDFNNILQVILSRIEMLKASGEAGERALRSLEIIDTSARKASDLIRRLLVFSRNIESELRPLNLNKVLKEMARILERTIPKMITLEFDLANDLWSVRGDPVQLEQVVMNLAVNAKDAMPEGGHLTFVTTNTTLTERFCGNNPGSKPGPHVLLKVTDTGSGMDQATLARIFEPFFTTKGEGKGTGLGLAMVYGIVKNHRGYVRCESSPHKGASFTLYFPALQEDVTQTSRLPSPRYPLGTETLLLVDDDPGVIEITMEILSSCGYKILTASDGQEALDVYERHRDEIDLVILDVIMPHMGGAQCLKGLMEINPSVKVLVTSGAPLEEGAMVMVQRGAKKFVPKPFELGNILRAIREAMGSD